MFYFKVFIIFVLFPVMVSLFIFLIFCLLFWVYFRLLGAFGDYFFEIGDYDTLVPESEACFGDEIYLFSEEAYFYLYPSMTEFQSFLDEDSDEVEWEDLDGLFDYNYTIDDGDEEVRFFEDSEEQEDDETEEDDNFEEITTNEVFEALIFQGGGKAPYRRSMFGVQSTIYDCLYDGITETYDEEEDDSDEEGIIQEEDEESLIEDYEDFNLNFKQSSSNVQRLLVSFSEEEEDFLADIDFGFSYEANFSLLRFLDTRDVRGFFEDPAAILDEEVGALDGAVY